MPELYKRKDSKYPHRYMLMVTIDSAIEPVSMEYWKDIIDDGLNDNERIEFIGWELVK